jgi:antitoxin component HigA of HigAB toxin-antitoxin module
MLGFVSAPGPWNTMSNLELRQSYKVLHNHQVLPSATTLSNICCREYALTVDAIKKQLPSQNKVSLVLDTWTSRNKLTITSAIAYYMD